MCVLVDQYQAEGRRPNWNAIALELKHPSSSCQQMMSRIRAQRRNGEIRKEMRVIKAEVAKKLELARLPPRPRSNDLTDTTRPTSTAKYLFDAELRSRIGAQGITAGLLGDPVPGRSALDKRRAGEIETARQPALASGAMRSPKTSLDLGDINDEFDPEEDMEDIAAKMDVHGKRSSFRGYKRGQWGRSAQEKTP